MTESDVLVDRLRRLEGPPVGSVQVDQLIETGQRRIRRRRFVSLAVGLVTLGLIVWGVIALVQLGSKGSHRTFDIGANGNLHVVVTVLRHPRHTKDFSLEATPRGYEPRVNSHRA